MSPDDRATWVCKIVAAAPPLSATQKATIRGTLLSGDDNETPADLITQGVPHPRIGRVTNLDDGENTDHGARRRQPIEVH